MYVYLRSLIFLLAWHAVAGTTYKASCSPPEITQIQAAVMWLRRNDNIVVDGAFNIAGRRGERRRKRRKIKRKFREGDIRCNTSKCTGTVLASHESTPFGIVARWTTTDVCYYDHVRSGESFCDLVGTMAHEFAHGILGKASNHNSAPPDVPRAQCPNPATAAGCQPADEVYRFGYFARNLCENDASTNDASLPQLQYRKYSRGCVLGANIALYRDQTVRECAELCSANSQCVGFEYGMPFGGAGPYNSHDCQLSSSSNRGGCDGSFYNLDFYQKRY